MDHKISGKHIFAFSKDNAPALVVQSGASVEMETLDCFANQLQSVDDRLEALDWERINPATGPVYIEGAVPGDVLKVTVERIRISDRGIMSVGKGMGVLGDMLDGLKFKLMPIQDGFVQFNSEISLPVTPMIGVIGVAPEAKAIGCGTPGPHGGNMDNQMVTAGAILYFPVFVEGALFAIGDLHAAMGDGEIGVTGVEVSGNARVKLEVLKGVSLKNPVLENTDYFTTIASAKRLEDAVKQAALDMAGLLADRLCLPLSEVVMLMSAVGNAQICQIVDPLMTARFVMPKYVANNILYKE
jgi:amidase